MRLRRLTSTLCALVLAAAITERLTRFVFLHETDIHRPAAALEIDIAGRDRPASLPFQRQSQSRLWENTPNYPAPGSDPPQPMINSLGCRAPELVEPKQRLRVLCLGDSSTFGLGVSAEEAYCAQLDSSLRELGGAGAEPMNCGVVGYTVLQGKVAFDELSPAVHPDVVVLAFGYNERWHHRTGDAPALAARKDSPLRRLLQSSEAYLLLRHLLLTLRPASTEPAGREAGPRVSPELFEDTLGKLCRRIQATGAKPALLVLVENPRISRGLIRATELLDAGNAAEAVELLRPIVASKLHRYPIADQLCARAVEVLGRDGVPPEIAARAELSGQRSWGRAFTESRYLEAAARVAQSTGAPLVRFPPERFVGMYSDDIHPSAPGHAWIAKRLAEAFVQAGWQLASKELPAKSANGASGRE